MPYVTKTQQAINAWQAGDQKTALKIVSGFRKMDRATLKVLQLGYEAMVHPEFYEQLHGPKVVRQRVEEALARLEEYIQTCMGRESVEC